MSASSSLPNLSGVLEKLKFIISLQRQQFGLILFNFLLVILSSGTSAVIPYFTKLQIDQLEQQSPQLLSFSHSPLFVLFLLLLIPALIELIRITLFDRFQSEVTTKIGTKLKMATETIIWKKLLTLDAGFFLSQRNKKIITDCLGSSRVIESFISFLSSRISGVTGLLTIIPILAFVSIPLLLIISAVALLQFFLNKTVNRYKQAYSLLERQQSDRQWRVRELLEDHTFDVIATGGFDQALSEYNKSRLLSDDLYFQSESSNRKLRAVNWLLDNILFISANLFVGNQVLQGNLSIGTFTLVVSYTSLISNTLYRVLESFNEWYYIDIDLEKLQFLFSLESRLKSSDNPKPIPKDPNSLKLEGVSFRYPNAFAEENQYLQTLIKKIENRLVKKDSYYEQELKRWQDLIESQKDKPFVLEDVSITLEKGKIVALVGKNGSGKTTATHLLQHHFEPQVGSVLLNDQPIYNHTQSEVLKQFSWIKQQPVILERYSVKENLLFGNSHQELSEPQLDALLDKLGLLPAINALPNRYESVLGEDTHFSGGQNQLIAIARAILQKRPFLIFDEGSSQLDLEKEFAVLQLLNEIKQDVGILFITHRMSVARKADYLYVMDAGKVIQSGTHNELIKTEGLYQHFWNMQTVS